MHLTDEEQAMLAGDFGPGVRKAMEIITALGKIYGAADLVPVTSVQVAGVSYKNLGDAGLEFLTEWTAQGARVRVPTMLNPAGVDLERWQELGFDAAFADKQQRVIQTFAAMGIRTTCTCTPYLIGNVPRRGEHVAWAESSAVSFANSVLGARTNREGGPGALAAAITGRTARFGLHLPEHRRATLVVEVDCPVTSFSDFGALGAMVGKIARNRVPFFVGLDISIEGERIPGVPFAVDLLRGMGAAMAATGAVALYHVHQTTPEADIPDIIDPDAETVRITSLREGYAALNSSGGDEGDEHGNGDEIDLVWIGCPHASLTQLATVVEQLRRRGQKARTALWVTLARDVRQEAAQMGLVEALEELGGRVVADTCLVVAPVKHLGFRRMATMSAKGACYTPGHSGLQVRYGSLEACLEAAVTGHWRGAGPEG
jgi:hypothetical protein